MTLSTTTETVTATTVVVPEYLSNIASFIVSNTERAIELVERVPGGEILIKYIKHSYQDDPYRSLFEVLLLMFAITYFLKSKSSYSKKDYVKLSNKEINELVADWQPEPLVLPLNDKEEWQLDLIPVLVDEINVHQKILDPASGEPKEVLNLASLNFLNLASHPEVKQSAIDQLKTSGVGACGPPNFYGTQDVHVRLEEHLADYFGAEKAILYAQDIIAPQSIIPCFMKRGDIVVLDGGVNLLIQKAVKISRCEVHWFDHNDMSSLEQVLKNLREDLKGEALTRRFIITEALSENYGDIPNLKRIIELKKEYKYRLMLDESRSLGVLGKTGRGIVELFNVDRSEIDVTIGSLAQSLASSGAFCIGEVPMIDHQKIQSNGYVFSALLPAYCARVAIASLSVIQQSTANGSASEVVSKLQSNTEKLFSLITSNKTIAKYMVVISSPESPTIHLRLSPKLRESLKLPSSYGGLGSEMMKFVEKGIEERYFDEDYNLECYLLQTIIDSLVQSGILIGRTQRILHHEILPLIPELLINVNSGLNNDDIKFVAQTVAKSIGGVLSKMTLKKFDDLLD